MLRIMFWMSSGMGAVASQTLPSVRLSELTTRTPLPDAVMSEDVVPSHVAHSDFTHCQFGCAARVAGNAALPFAVEGHTLICAVQVFSGADVVTVT